MNEETVSGDVAISDGNKQPKSIPKEITLKSFKAKRKKLQESDGSIMGRPYILVDHETFKLGLQGKQKSKHWKKYLGATEDAARIQAFSNKQNGKPFFLKSKHSGDYINAKA